ncbi:beta-glucosidase family protein [Saccharopolyspora sp. 5N708]|uniref:beta-glucosidase family protein n=1 Tax=Saccharopolyspora sp. 5N708 TaxID=3457424 RepID=UPI003FD0C2B8
MSEERIERLLARLPLEDRVRLLTGETAWKLYALPEIGLRQMTVSDGPIGVRGVTEQRLSSAQLPAPSAMAATWDAELIADLGRIMAAEAVAKAADVVLAPVVNLQRTPVAGRHFECFSEDPLLSGRMATAFVEAVQAEGVGVCVKHFVGNDSETERTSYVARIAPRALREVYLAPFEQVVRDGKPWMVMAAYNAVDDGVESSPATEHDRLLAGVLKGEWGFDGVVVSDWLATKSTVESARTGLDLVMPGPGGPWREHLLAAVRGGEVPEKAIDEKVRRLLRLAERVGALDGTPPAAPRNSGDDPATVATLRSAAARATVVLRNETSLLPLRPDIQRIALIGANALDPFVQGGGSAHVVPPHVASPLAEIARAFPDAEVTAHRGGTTRRHLPLLDGGAFDGGAFEIEVLDAAGSVVQRRTESAPWSGRVTELPDAADTVRVRTTLRPTAPGDHLVEVAPVGRHHVSVDGRTLSESERIAGPEVVLDSSANHPEGVTTAVEITEPRDVEVIAEVQAVTPGSFVRFAHVEVRHQEPGPSVEDEIAEAVAAARRADVAVVVVGTNDETESEGWDRPHLDLPGRQNDLVRRVAEVNDRTVVVVNAGAPVLLPWLDEVPAALWWWLPGQEAGGSLADVLTGAVEPTGRLPWTLPARAADVPVPHAIPVDGVVDYAEGLDVGHRGWDRLGRVPAREFGFGLGYSTWQYGDAVQTGPRQVTVPVVNTGARRAREVVQAYLTAPGQDRPVRWLAGFAAVEVDPGAAAAVAVDVPQRAFEMWDESAGIWRIPAGEYILQVGRSSRDLRSSVRITVETAS